MNIDDFLGKYCMVRTCHAGVHAGVLISKEKDECILYDARRIWYWSGAATLSALAMEGTSKPDECKFPIPVEKILLIGVIEIIPISEKAEKSIRGVEVWK